MSTNIWNASEIDFATRITLNDVQGFFTKELVVAPGTRALILDNGVCFGEVPPGTYTLESFSEKIAANITFWKLRKTVDVLLVRQDDIRVTFFLDKIPTAEGLLVAVKLALVVQIKDVSLFLRNKFGAKNKLSVEELKQAVGPIIMQALRDTIKQLSIATLTSPDARDLFVTGVRESAKTSLARYGISCEDIQAVEVVNEQYDEQRRKTGEIFLLDQSVTQQKALDEVFDRETLQKIEHREREHELAVLAANIEIDKNESEVATTLRRCEVRKNMRDAVLSDRFDQVKTKEELAAFLLEVDKQKTVRDDERHELESLFEAKKNDRKSARDFLVRKMEYQRNAELDQLAASIAHAEKLQTLQHEIELTKISDDEETRRWRQTLEREAEKSNHDYREAMKTTERQQELNSKQLKFMRAEEWEDLLQKQKTTRLNGEIREEEAAKEVRVSRIKDEYEIEQERRKHVLQQEMQLDQMKLLREMEQMNRERDEFESGLLLKTESQRHQQQVELLNARAAMSVEALIATSETANAEALAKVQMSKNESSAQAAIREEAARRERELQEQRIKDAQTNNATTLDAVQKITGQAFGAMGQVVGRPASMPGYGSSTDPNVPRVAVCNGCRAENPPTARFCANCGKEL